MARQMSALDAVSPDRWSPPLPESCSSRKGRCRPRRYSERRGLTFPPEFEHSFHDAALIARILIDGSPPLSWPTDDPNRKALWRVDEAPISLEAMITCRDEWRLVTPPHAGGRHVGELRRVKVHAGWRFADSTDDFI
jgi:hypothetical protein